MAIELQKINVKFYLTGDTALSPEDAFRVFSQWIPETTDELLIDVADYAHVPRGPRTVLVGHEANYVLDDSDGRLGLLYGCKRRLEGGNGDRLRAAFVAALRACQRLEEAEPAGRFAGGEALVVANDRLSAPNEEATLDAVRADLGTVLDQLYAGAEAQVERLDDPRRRFSVRVRVAGEFPVADLLVNLGS